MNFSRYYLLASLRIGMATTLWIAVAGTTMIACFEMFHYVSSDPEKVKQFLIEQNILCPGDDIATVLAMIDWSRRNLVHADKSEEIQSNSKSILELINESKNAGYVTINGCWGTADFFQQTMGAVGIQTTYDIVQISGSTGGLELHASTGLPVLERTALHSDNLHQWNVSSRTGEIPAEEIPAPTRYLDAFGTVDAAIIYQQESLIKRFLPDIKTWFRIRNYGKFYTDEQIRKANSGEASINDVAVSRDVLQMIDAEIDRLGGPANARLTLEQVIDFPETHRALVAVPVGKFCKKNDAVIHVSRYRVSLQLETGAHHSLTITTYM